MSLSIKLLGGATLAGERGALTGPAVQRHRLALLALLAVHHPRAVSRDKLMALLWPERDTEHARRLLNQAVHALRQALGPDPILSAGEDLQLVAGLIACDVIAFEQALAGGAPERAAALYAGPFLDGFFLDDAPEFERWAARERDRLAGAWAAAVEGLAEAAERAGDPGAATSWWKARAAGDPYDSRVALRLMRTLERAGHRAGALQHAAQHQRLLREELGIEVDPEVSALVERLRREPARSAGSTSQDAGHSTLPPLVALAAEVAPSGLHAEAGPIARAPAAAETAVRRHGLQYTVAALLAGIAIIGAMRLAARSGETDAMPSPRVVDRIADAVARELERRRQGDTGARLPPQRTKSIPAYELYLRGDDPVLLRSDSGARSGLEYFRRAVALDSTYAAAWAAQARLLFRLTNASNPDSLRATRAAAEAAVRKALSLDDSLAEAHALLGVFRTMDFDYAAAEPQFRRAIELEPTRTRLREWYAGFLLWTERPEEALAEAQRALAITPRSASAVAEVARALAANDRCDEALRRLETIAALDPPLLRAAGIAAECYDRQSRWAEGIAALRDAISEGQLGYLHARAGHRKEALAIQARLLEGYRRGAVGSFDLAFVPAGLGDRDQAFAWLDRALEDGTMRFYPARVVGIVGAPFGALRQDPRMERLRERMGLGLRSR